MISQVSLWPALWWGIINILLLLLQVSLRSALWWSMAWIALACSFGYFAVFK